MSREGILKYPPPLLLPLEGSEICLHARSFTYQNFDKTSFYLNFQLLVPFSLPLVLKMQFLLWVEFWAISMFFSKFRKCTCISLKPYKWNWSKLWSWKQFCCTSIKQKIYPARFHFYNIHIFKGQGPLEGEGVEVGTSKYLPGTYFSL